MDSNMMSFINRDFIPENVDDITAGIFKKLSMKNLQSQYQRGAMQCLQNPYQHGVVKSRMVPSGITQVRSKEDSEGIPYSFPMPSVGGQRPLDRNRLVQKNTIEYELERCSEITSESPTESESSEIGLNYGKKLDWNPTDLSDINSPNQRRQSPRQIRAKLSKENTIDERISPSHQGTDSRQTIQSKPT